MAILYFLPEEAAALPAALVSAAAAAAAVVPAAGAAVLPLPEEAPHPESDAMTIDAPNITDNNLLFIKLLLFTSGLSPAA